MIPNTTCVYLAINCLEIERVCAAWRWRQNQKEESIHTIYCRTYNFSDGWLSVIATNYSVRKALGDTRIEMTPELGPGSHSVPRAAPALLKDVPPQSRISVAFSGVNAFVPVVVAAGLPAPDLPEGKPACSSTTTSTSKERQVLYNVSACVEPGGILSHTIGSPLPNEWLPWIAPRTLASPPRMPHALASPT